MRRDASILALAVSSGQLAYMLLEQGAPAHWYLWRGVTRDPLVARSKARTVIARLCPDVVVIEDPWNGCRKTGQSLAVLQTLAQAIADEPVRAIRLRRPARFPNRYEEAWALCDRFPLLKPWRPEKPAFYDPEPRHLLVFEALALATDVHDALTSGRG